MVSIKELRKICVPKYKTKPPWRILFARKVSIYFTWLFIKTPLVPNQITFMMLVLGIIVGILFMFGNYFYSLIAILLFQLAFFIDCSDGEVARWKKMESSRGFYLDLMTHIIVNPLIIIGISIGAFINNPTIIPNYVFLIVGGIATYSLMINNFVKLKKYEVYIKLNEFEKLKSLDKRIDAEEDDNSNKIKNEITGFFKISIFDALFVFGVLNLLPYLVLLYGILFPLQAIKRFYSEFKSEKSVIPY